MTPRSYSLTILMALSMTETTNIAIMTNTMAEKPIPTACNKPKVAYIRNPPFILPGRDPGHDQIIRWALPALPLRRQTLSLPPCALPLRPRRGLVDQVPRGRRPARPATPRHARTPAPQTPLRRGF